MHPAISISSICFLQDSLARQAQYWRELQTRRIGLAGPQLDTETPDAIRQALASGSYTVETIMHPLMFARALNPDPDTWIEPRAQLRARIEQAAQLGAKSIYMTTGGHGELTWEQAATTFAGIIAPCVERAQAAGVRLMIENAPALYADTHIAHTLRDTIALAQIADIGICIDLVGCWTEAGLRSLIEQAVPRCGLVQVSDYVAGDRSLPARAVPGDGNLPLARILGWLLETGYDGAFELELLGPRIDREGHFAATRRAAQRLGEILQSLGQ